MKKLVKIDADSLIFYSSKETIEDSIFNIKERINTILNKTGATHYMLCLTGSGCFRYNIYKDYKANRKTGKYPQLLKYLKTLKSFLIEEYNALLIQELEADDLVAFNYTLEDMDQVVSSPDKDVLNQVIGSNYNYGKDEFINVTTESSDRFLAWQLLVGDTGDNIKGLESKTDYIKVIYGLDNRKGIGEVTANRMLDIMDEKKQDYAIEILKCYISKYEDDLIPTVISESNNVKVCYPIQTKEEKGFEDYTLNRHLLQLNIGIGRFNKILENYDISENIKEVKSINQIQEEF